jgi:hypothetical protein
VSVLGTIAKPLFLVFRGSRTWPDLQREAHYTFTSFSSLRDSRSFDAWFALTYPKPAKKIMLSGTGILTSFPSKSYVNGQFRTLTYPSLIVIGREPLPTCGDDDSRITLLLLSVRFSFKQGPHFLKEMLLPSQDASLPLPRKLERPAYRWIT